MNIKLTIKIAIIKVEELHKYFIKIFKITNKITNRIEAWR